MAHSNLPEATPTVQLEALTEAYAILKQAAGQCAGYAADRPYGFLSHARDYISDQADALLSPIFTDDRKEAL